MSSVRRIEDGKRLNGASILADVRDYITRYVRFSSEEDANAVALFVLHTYCMDAVRTTPYLGITSDKTGSGKSQLLDVLGTVVKSPWRTSNTTAPVIMRVPQELFPTMLIDEIDATFKGNKEAAEAVRQIINSGHTRGSNATRLDGTGPDARVMEYQTFCAKAFASLGSLPETIADRSIPIRLTKQKRGTVALFFPDQVEDHAEDLRARMRAWSEKHIESVKSRIPLIEWPERVTNSRTAQMWGILVAIADECGTSVGEYARAALIAIHCDEDEDEEGNDGDVILSTILDAMARGYIRARGANGPVPIGTTYSAEQYGNGANKQRGAFTTVAVWVVKEFTVELRIPRDSWVHMHRVLKRHYPDLPSAQDTLKTLRKNGYLITDKSGGYTCKVNYQASKPAEPTYRIDVSRAIQAKKDS